MRHFKIVIERHDDGFVAYPVGLRGIVVGQGDTLDEALVDVRSAIQFHLETFDAELLHDRLSSGLAVASTCYNVLE